MGAGPIGLITALGLAHYGIASVVFEDDRQLSLETKAGTILSRTLEIFHRYGVADKVLAKALRVDEIGEIDKKTFETKCIGNSLEANIYREIKEIVQDSENQKAINEGFPNKKIISVQSL